MRIVQLIDSLDVGGAERMAVNFANALSKEVAFSGLVTTRKEGPLKEDITAGVGYCFLRKSKTIDVGAVLRLRSYCKQHQIDLLHAHGSSFFTATLLKLTLPRIKIVWHDHNGDRSSQTKNQNKVLGWCARWFSGIIAVNHKLEQWSRMNLEVQNVIYLPNFTVASHAEGTTKLYGAPGKRILYLANLRHPKNHMMLMTVALHLHQNHPNWTIHLVGKDSGDAYAQEIKAFISANGLHETVYIYGLKTDTAHIIGQSDIAVIASSYEGLPVSLLEYGLYRKPVVVTQVGEIPQIVSHGNNGFIVPSTDSAGFGKALELLIRDTTLRERLANELYQTINDNHSQAAVVGHYLHWIETKL